MVKGTGIKECLKHAWKNSFLPAGLEAIGEIERKQRKNVFWLNVSKKPLACTMEKVVDEKQNKKWRKNEATRQWSISFFFFFFFLVGCFFGLSILIPDDTTEVQSSSFGCTLNLERRARNKRNRQEWEEKISTRIDCNGSHIQCLCRFFFSQTDENKTSWKRDQISSFMMVV